MSMCEYCGCLVADSIAHYCDVQTLQAELTRLRSEAERLTQHGMTHLNSLLADRDDLRAKLEAATAFKTYVHKRLDDAGIPTHPEGEHSAAGCRIGDRLDIVFARLAHFETEYENCMTCLGAQHGYVMERK